MGVVLYFTMVSSNLETKKRQQKITMVLDGKKIGYEVKDVSSSSEDKDRMRELAGDGALPPQICHDDQYCGDYEAFEDAVEGEKLKEFLKL